MDVSKKILADEVAAELGYDKKLVRSLVNHYEHKIPHLIRQVDEKGYPVYEKIFLYRFGRILLKLTFKDIINASNAKKHSSNNE